MDNPPPVRLQSFGPDLRIALFGAGAGIGGGLLAHLATHPRVARIYAGRRTPIDSRHPKITPFAFDLTDPTSLERAASAIVAEGVLDLVLVATGVLQLGDSVKPEKTWRSLTPEALSYSFAVNTIGPALIGKFMLDHLRRDRKSAFAALSARVGSIGDNRLGGWHAYRASKAALNMLIRNFAIELAQRNPAALCVGLHPGTVDTALSRPFQSAGGRAGILSPTDSAAFLLDVLDQLRSGDSGGQFAWDGQRVPD